MLARAKTTDNKIREGYYIFSDKHEDEWGKYDSMHWMIGNNKEQSNYVIDPKTVEYKIGNEWFTLSRLEKIIILAKHLAEEN